MKHRRESMERLERVLRQAHRCRPAFPADERWVQTVMRRIHNLPAPVFGAAGQWWSFGAFVWRLAPATAILALIALAALMNFTLIADGDLFQLFYAETQMLSLADF